MNTRFKLPFFSLFLFLLLGFSVSCDDDDDAPESLAGDFVIVNEGNFGQGNGSISVYNRNSDAVENNVFASANDGRTLGANVQSVSVHDEVAFVVCNAADKIEIIDANNFEALQAPLADSALVSPRYLAVSGNKAYVSVWGPFDSIFALNESKVAVIDLSDYTIMQYLNVAAGPEGIIAADDQVYVANSFSNTITVIDTNSDEVIEEIILEGSPLLFAKNGADVWVSVKGASAQFVRINTSDNSIAETISVTDSNSNGKFVINQSLSKIYFIGAESFPSTSTTLQELSLDDTSSGIETLISGDHFYGVGTDPANDDILLGNSNSFQGEGTVLRYNTLGDLLQTYAVGVGPNNFIIQ